MARDGSFVDHSGISGADSIADGRAFAVLDYNRDGKPDLALVNANAPLLQLFENRNPDRNFVAIRLVGSPAPDAIGALVTGTAGGRELNRALRAGEGLAAQNSKTMLIGIGDAEALTAVSVRWPSGEMQAFGDIAAGELAVITQGQPAIATAPYKRETANRAPPEPQTFPVSAAASSSLRVYSTFATWCEVCAGEVPELVHLRNEMPEATLYGLHYDRKETHEQALAWARDKGAPFEVLPEQAPEEIEKVRRLIVEQLGSDSLPVSFITDSENRLLRLVRGAPTVSDLRELSR